MTTSATTTIIAIASSTFILCYLLIFLSSPSQKYPKHYNLFNYYSLKYPAKQHDIFLALDKI